MIIFKKIIFLFKKPKVIIVTGKNRRVAAEAIFYLLKNFFRVERLSEKFPSIIDIYKKEILILESDLRESTSVKKFKFLVEKSQLPILVIAHFGDVLPAAHSGESRPQSGRDKETAQFKKIIKNLPSHGQLIFNFDNKAVKKLKEEANLRTTSFGFQEGADFQASDINLNSHINFKINYKGNIVPVWLPLPNPAHNLWAGLEGLGSGSDLGMVDDKEKIYSALIAIAVGTILKLNLVEISNIFKNY